MNEINKKTDLAIDSLIIAIADLKTVNRKALRNVQTLSLVMMLLIGGASYWFFYQYSSPHVRFITDGETKTLIGLKKPGRIQVNVDDHTGESILEVYNGKK